jgi:hypothetical protein
MTGRERVIEVVVQRAASQQKIPSLGAVQDVLLAAEPRFVFADHLLQMVIQGHGVRRHAIVEIENRDGRVRLLYLLPPVGDIQ